MKNGKTLCARPQLAIQQSRSRVDSVFLKTNTTSHRQASKTKRTTKLPNKSQRSP